MPNILSSSHLIGQSDKTVFHPGTSTPAFTDTNFYKTTCGKTGTFSGTISGNGCAIVTLAMFMLYKGGLSNTTKSNVYEAVVEATKRGTNENVDFKGAQSFTATVAGKSISVKITTTTDLGTELKNSKICIARFYQGSNSHYVLVDGWDSTASGLDCYLVSDARGGTFRTIKTAMTAGGFTADAQYITERYVIS